MNYFHNINYFFSHFILYLILSIAASDFGLYQMSSTVNSNSADAVGKSGRWLDPEHELQYYLLRDNVRNF